MFVLPPWRRIGLLGQIFWKLKADQTEMILMSPVLQVNFFPSSFTFLNDALVLVYGIPIFPQKYSPTTLRTTVLAISGAVDC